MKLIQNAWNRIPIGTRSVLFGAHQFVIHPLFVAAGWTKLYGFPFDPRLWVAFFVHDLGYIGKPNMDGPEGETHVELGAKIMYFLFDHGEYGKIAAQWGEFCLLHSRYYAKKLKRTPSALCFADKMAFVLMPSWLYLPLVSFTGELQEYIEDSGKRGITGRTNAEWLKRVQDHTAQWIYAHIDGRPDTWTKPNRREEASNEECKPVAF